MYNQGLALFQQRKYADAGCLWRRVLQGKQIIFSDDHPDLDKLQQQLEMAIRAQESLLYRIILFLRGFLFAADSPQDAHFSKPVLPNTRLKTRGALMLIPSYASLASEGHYCSGSYLSAHNANSTLIFPNH